MKELVVAGGLYAELCIWPEWKQVYGSAGRAAIAASSHVDRVRLITCASPALLIQFEHEAALNGIFVDAGSASQAISFEYNHCLSTPIIRPLPSQIIQIPPLKAAGEAVLRFGMMESSVHVDGQRCVYDPQSAFDPEPFTANGSKAEDLAIVGNRSEIRALAGVSDPFEAGRKLIAEGATVVVVKAGALGAHVITADREETVPAYRSNGVWTLGSGDVFAAIFAAHWAAARANPTDAADLASRAVSNYAESRALPSPLTDNLRAEERKPLGTVPGQVYLASPFFSMGQRWLVDEARKGFKELGVEVFSPVHEIGPGPADFVAPADIKGIESSDRLFAILDGNDPGTLFEVGYAVKKDIPVYALAQNVSDEDLKMVLGSGCKVYSDFVTALHHTAWKI